MFEQVWPTNIPVSTLPLRLVVSGRGPTRWCASEPATERAAVLEKAPSIGTSSRQGPATAHAAEVDGKSPNPRIVRICCLEPTARGVSGSKQQTATKSDGWDVARCVPLAFQGSEYETRKCNGALFTTVPETRHTRLCDLRKRSPDLEGEKTT
ncbi:hypothetical protein FI667_g10038, partial [Globisporangium splendens]